VRERHRPLASGLGCYPRPATCAPPHPHVCPGCGVPTIGCESVRINLPFVSKPKAFGSTAASPQLGHLLKGDALLQLPLGLVDNDSSDNHDAFDHHLPEFTDAHHHEAVGKNADHKRADDRPADRAPPPDMEVPPRTAAAMAFNSNVVPVAGCDAINSEEMIKPTIAAQKPENM